MLKIEGLIKNFQRNGVLFPAVNKINLTVEQGDWVQIVGRSGSGKTTFLNLVTGLLKPDEGNVTLFDCNLTQLDDGRMSKIRNSWIGYIPQGNSLLDNFSVLDNVRLPYYLSVGHHDDITGRADYLLNEVGVAHLRNMYPYQLSGGEQRRVAIARALMNSPKILVADEPTSDLDITSIRTVMNLLEKIHSKGMTLLVVTHELDTVNLEQRVCVMQEGCLQEITRPALKKEDLVSCLSA